MAQSHRRLYIFDIDGTLIVSGGAGGKAMRAAFSAMWRRSDGFNSIEFSGRTDLAIYRDACRACGLEDATSGQGLLRFKRAYRRRLPASLRNNPGQVLPGVFTLLDKLSEDPDAIVALGTGNFRSTAAVKLGHYGLSHYFSMGGFGDATENRSELIADALRVAKRRGGSFGSAFVIGDTVHDVTSAKANGCIAVAVTTGTIDAASLSAAGADLVLESLESASEVLKGPS